MSFSIKPNLGTRKGWKIMPESGEPDPELLQRVIDMIHEMEFSGRAIPERITLKVWLDFGGIAHVKVGVIADHP